MRCHQFDLPALIITLNNAALAVINAYKCVVNNMWFAHTVDTQELDTQNIQNITATGIYCSEKK